MRLTELIMELIVLFFIVVENSAVKYIRVLNHFCQR